jgi:asparagine synthase (glutamine-hydrolysing)
MYGFLSHNFMIADKSSMEASLEMRVPLATKRLYEISFGQKDSFLVRGVTTKSYLKRLLAKFVSKELVYRRKTGFNPPLVSYINSIKKEDIIKYMDQRGLFDICNRLEVEKIVADNYSKKSNNVFQIFSLMYLAAWLKNYS